MPLVLSTTLNVASACIDAGFVVIAVHIKYEPVKNTSTPIVFVFIVIKSTMLVGYCRNLYVR